MSSGAVVVPVAQPDAAPELRSSGWWGMAILIATEATLFAVLLATYFYLRFTAKGSWPPDGVHDPKLLKPLIATVILVASSIPASVATRRGAKPVIQLALLLAAALGIAFLIFQNVLVDDSLKQFGPRDDAYGSIFYTLVGLHAAHVAAGVLLAVWACLRTVRLDRTAVVTVRVTAMYWHFVNVVAVLVFLVLYLSPRG